MKLNVLHVLWNQMYYMYYETNCFACSIKALLFWLRKVKRDHYLVGYPN